MKKSLFFLALFAMLTVPAYSGSKIIAVNPVGIIFGVPNVNVEFIRPNGLNPVVGGNLYIYSSSGWSVFGLGVNAGMRKYLEEGKTGHGLYVGGYGGLGMLSAKYAGASTSSLTFSVSGGVGYKVMFNDKYVIGLEGGLSVFLNSGITVGGVTLGMYSGVGPYGALELGIKI